MFSVIIPTYNRSVLVRRCLINLTKQKFKDFEVLLIDDGSTDNTKEIVADFDNILDIKYHYQSNTGAPASPRNLGIELANRKWICFLDSDDFWYEDKLEKVFLKITSSSSVEVLYHLMRQVDDSGRNLGQLGRFIPRKLALKNYLDLCYNGNRIVLSSLVVRRDCLFEVGAFNTEKGLVGIEDFDLVLRLARCGKRFYLIDEVLGDYLVAPSSLSSNDFSQINKIKVLFERMIREDALLKAYRLNQLTNYMLGNAFRKTGDLNNARLHYIRAFMRAPCTYTGAKALLKFW